MATPTLWIYRANEVDLPQTPGWYYYTWVSSEGEPTWSFAMSCSETTTARAVNPGNWRESNGDPGHTPGTTE